QGKKPDELLEDFIPIAESQVKWAIIKKKIIEKENIQIEDYDIDSIVEEHKRQNPNTSEEELRNYIKNTPHIVDTLLEKKVLDFIIGFAETTEIDFDEYMKMLEGQTTEENSLEPEETLVDSVENTNIKDQNQDTELKENR
ncbi:MAG: hypothetical protein ACPLRO_10220, partial [Candidatus Kapaibacteriota bacterium]